MLFGGWTSIGRTAIVGVLAYACLVVLLRISGKRTLSKMNAFDFVVTVALGSTLASILLSKDVSLASGVVALGVLIGMQYVVAWFSVRSATVRRLTRSEPRLLIRQGEFLPEAMRAERVSRGELLSAIRDHGLGGLQEVAALVLETDGSFSVIRSVDAARDDALRAVRGYTEH